MAIYYRSGKCKVLCVGFKQLQSDLPTGICGGWAVGDWTAVEYLEYFMSSPGMISPSVLYVEQSSTRGARVFSMVETAIGSRNEVMF